MRFFRCLYTAALYFILPLALLKLYWRGHKNIAYRKHWAERFGFVKKPVSKKIIWIHAVSVGETIAIRPLVEALITHYPEYKIWLTNGTINGRARTEAFFANRIFYSYAPYDSPAMVRRFIQRVQPALVLIMETEVWPNWIDALNEKNIPVVLVNARLSQKSYRGYQKWQCFFASIWQKFSLIAAQAETDAKRYQHLGVDPKKITAVGNLKYNLLLPNDLSEQVKQWQKYLPEAPIWIAASIHPGEEVGLLKTLAALKQQDPKLLCILVPRQLEDVAAIKKICSAESWSVTIRSEVGALPAKMIDTDVLLVDTIGELFLFYSLAQVAFVGGSFIEHGGHNILEPAAVGAAITCGPSMYNFSAILQEFKEAHALVQCQTIEELTIKTLALFADRKMRDDYVQAAKLCFAQHRNVLSTYLSLIGKFL
jgi:3-deoxy-D-manno-octulosonic-acid transferase